MRKDDSGKSGWPKHTRNTQAGKAGINRANRRNVKRALQKTNAPPPVERC